MTFHVKKVVVFFLILSSGFVNELKAQSQVVTPIFPFLSIHPDAQTTMNAGTLTGISSTIPTAFFYNPAQLGNFGNTNSISFQFFPGGNTWFQDVSLHSNSFVAGRKLQNLPLSLGIGYINFGIDYGTQIIRTLEDPEGESGETFSARDYTNMIAFGVQLHTPIKLSLGYSVKRINSKIYSQKISGNAFDLGILASYDLKIEKFTSELSLGYSIRNEGKQIEVLNESDIFIDIDENSSDPVITTYPNTYSLPRNHILGYGLRLGFEDVFLNKQRNIFQFSWSAQIQENKYKYSNSDFLLTNADIYSLFDNMVTGKSGDNLQNSNALTFDLLESLSLTWGEFYIDGLDNPVDTFGFSIFMKPLLSFFIDGDENSFTQFFIKYLDVSYSFSTYSAYDNPVIDDTYISGLSISIHGF